MPASTSSWSEARWRWPPWAADQPPLEQVEIYNISRGTRFSTYCIAGEAGSGEMGIKGAAAHRAAVGELVIIAAYCHQEPQEIASRGARVVLVDGQNCPSEVCEECPLETVLTEGT